MFNNLFDNTAKELKKAMKVADQVLSKEVQYSNLSDEELKDMTLKFREELEKGKTLDDILVDAFAVAREACKRVLGLHPFKVQLAGGYILHGGNVAEMKTGEGKTLTAVMPSYLNALSGKGVHIITVNEYLAKTQSEEMAQVFHFLGLTTGLNLRDITKEQKKEAYLCDILYTTNAEVGFDYLRDHMVMYKEQMVQRKLNFCIIDEADSILIDEARTPLIISGGEKNTHKLYEQADMAVKMLREGDYEVEIKDKTISLTPEGISRLEQMFNLPNIYDVQHVGLLHRINNALRANYVMANQVDYVVSDGVVVIVDQFTGRLMPGRQFSDGLHQALEAKEKVEVKKETSTLATITYQNFFRMYSKLSGMTGTAKTEEEEFTNIYNMYVVEIPTNRPVIRKDLTDLLYSTMKEKYDAITEEVKRLNGIGQPILIGTISIETSEYLSGLLKRAGVRHTVLNAKQHEKEAQIVELAGQKGAVTIATNMAGRGTDIKLGEGVKELGGLAVIGTERHESRRIDNQLRGRSGRQGDPGYSRFYLSAQDELLLRFGGDRFKMMIDKLANDTGKAIESKMITKSVESAQKRIEGNNFDIRKNILQYDEVIRLQRNVIYEQRELLLTKEDVSEEINKMVSSYIEDLVDSNTNNKVIDTEKVTNAVNSLLALEEPLTDIVNPKSKQATVDKINELLFTNLKEKHSEVPEHVYKEFLKVISLRVVDTHWINHIDRMDALRQSVRLQAYGQVNPLNEYKDLGLEMFNDMVFKINKDLTNYLFKAQIRQNTERKEVATPIKATSGKELKKAPVTKKTT